MNNNDKRMVATVLAGAVIVGAMFPNYIGIVRFFKPAAAEVGIWWMAWAAALVYDAAWLFASWATITGGAGRWSRIMLIGGVIGAVAINLRLSWLATSAAGLGWGVDAMLGHAALPVIGLLAVHGLAHYLATVPPDAPAATQPTDADTRKEWFAPFSMDDFPVPPPIFDGAPPKPPAPRKPKPPRAAPAATGTGADWHPEALRLLSEGYSGADVARMVGKDAAQVSRLKAKANGAGAMNGNGSAPTS